MKLKCSAVPTLFDVPNPPMTVTPVRRPLKRQLENIENCVVPHQHDHRYVKRRVLADFNQHSTVDVNAVCHDEDVASHAAAESDTCCAHLEKIRQIEQQVRKLQRHNVTLRAKLTQFQQRVNTVFSKDQLSSLQNRSRATKWQPSTIKKSLQIRYACGASGYEFLRSSGYPLPAYRTLCDHVQNLQMAPGLDSNLLDMLTSKLSVFTEYERECCLLIDEVQLKEKLEYDQGLKRLVGTVADCLSNTSGRLTLASHALCFMVRGLQVSWKQLIAWYPSGSSISGEKQWFLAKEIIDQLYARGVTVVAVVSDMGPNNQAMWRHVGICSKRDCLVNSIPHPSTASRQIFFLADVPHLLKNLRNMLLTQDLTISDEVVQRNSLPCSKVSLEYVRELIRLQEERQLKVVPGLSARHLRPAKYEKMKVDVACKLFSNSCCSGLRYFVELGLVNVDGLTTAWFLELVNNWFDIMASRHSSCALYPTSANKISLLNDVLHIAKTVKFSGSHSWKPIQTGMQLSTKSVLDIFDQRVSTGKSQFLLTSRCSQDALENVFSQVRGRGDSHPSSMSFRFSIRAICLSQFMAVPNSSSYHVDNTPHLIDLIRSRKRSSPSPNNLPDDNDSILSSSQLIALSQNYEVDVIDRNVIAYIAGWVLFKLHDSISNCDECRQWMTAGDAHQSDITLTATKSFGGLHVPSQALIELFVDTEKTFRQNIRLLSTANVEAFLLGSVEHTMKLKSCCPYLNCHGVCAIQKYLRLRLHAHASSFNKQHDSQFASRSAACRTLIK